jgi:GNAT superfamily N-acetyltransferase
MAVVTITPLTLIQVDSWMDAHVSTRGVAHVPRLSRFWDEHQSGARIILCAWQEDSFVGHVTLLLQSHYPTFRKNNVAEIVDLWVQPDARDNGTGRALLQAIEQVACEKHHTQIGLGVGVTQEYGAAHRLYHQQGYAPDGTGLWASGVNITEGTTITCDDNCLLMLVKK